MRRVFTNWWLWTGLVAVLLIALFLFGLPMVVGSAPSLWVRIGFCVAVVAIWVILGLFRRRLVTSWWFWTGLAVGILVLLFLFGLPLVVHFMRPWWVDNRFLRRGGRDLADHRLLPLAPGGTSECRDR